MTTQENQKDKYDVIVIGGGASGMMAAGAAAENGYKVLILEKNKSLGEKLKITGGGRCNITNATFDEREFLKKFGKAESFLYSPLSQFGVQDTFDFFEKRGLPIVVEARNRAFPKTQRASDVVYTMMKYTKNKNITIQASSPVVKVNFDKENKQITSVKTKNGIYSADKYILATGGVSHPETGSTGDGFRWLEKIGHTVNKPSPNIVPLKTPDKWVHDLSGRSLSFMKITFYVSGRKAFSEKGKILFTHFGISGPLILNSAKKVADLLHEGQVTATIDCYPDTDHGSLEKQILKTFDQNKNKDYKNIVDEIAPDGLGNTLIEFHIVPDVNKKVHSITKDERKQIVQLLKALPLSIEGLMGMDRAVISDGGIPLTEVDTKTMRSKVCKNLYLTGDILHINRPSGGYSLQLCWTTGFVAGKLG
jgi:predicted Rossmann fold flavoprotein